MPRGYQQSLFGGGPGKGFLFDKRLVEQYLSDHVQTHIPDAERHGQVIRRWIDAIRTTAATETSLELLCLDPPLTPDDHQVVHQHFQQHVAFAAGWRLATQFVAEVALDHAHHRLDLPTLRVAAAAA